MEAINRKNVLPGTVPAEAMAIRSPWWHLLYFIHLHYFRSSSPSLRPTTSTNTSACGLEDSSLPFGYGYGFGGVGYGTYYGGPFGSITSLVSSTSPDGIVTP